MEMDGFEKWLLRTPIWRALTQYGVLPWVLRAGDLPDQAQVLELGGGGGFNAERLLGRFPGWHLTATDYDPDMVELLRRRLGRFGDNVSVQSADATALPFADSRFDLVVAVFVWHHVGDWRAALRECRRVLTPGGRLLLADLTSGFFRGPLLRLFPPRAARRLRDLGPPCE
jgi:ubiquinone/menaquinone biosynthesis C-methylase UbiE